MGTFLVPEHREPREEKSRILRGEPSGCIVVVLICMTKYGFSRMRSMVCSCGKGEDPEHSNGRFCDHSRSCDLTGLSSLSVRIAASSVWALGPNRLGF